LRGNWNTDLATIVLLFFLQIVSFFKLEQIIQACAKKYACQVIFDSQMKYKNSGLDLEWDAGIHQKAFEVGYFRSTWIF